MSEGSKLSVCSVCQTSIIVSLTPDHSLVVSRKLEEVFKKNKKVTSDVTIKKFLYCNVQMVWKSLS